MLAPLRVLLSLLCLPRNSPNLSRLALGLILLCLLATPALAQGEFIAWFNTLSYSPANDRFFANLWMANAPPLQTGSTTRCFVNGAYLNCLPGTSVDNPGQTVSHHLNGATGRFEWYAVISAGTGERAETPKRIFRISADPPANTLATPKSFAIHQDSAKVEWRKPADATGYEVRVRKCGGEPKTCETAQTLTLGDVAEANLKDASNCCSVDVAYQARIRATNASSNSAWSDWTDFTYTWWSPADFRIEENGVAARWTAETGASGYNAEIEHIATGETGYYTPPAGAVEQNLTLGANPCCLNGEKYRARIRIWLGTPGAYARWSNWINFTFTRTSTLPPRPTGLTVDGSTTAVAWSAVTGDIGTGYRIELQSSADATSLNYYPSQSLSTVTLNLLTDPIDTDHNSTRICCTFGESYRIRIQTRHSSNVKTPPTSDKESLWTDWVTFTYGFAPDRPTDLEVDSDEGSASWTKSAHASHYRVQLREVIGVGYGATASLNLGDVDSLDFTTAAGSNCCVNGVSYQTRILARNSYGESAYTDPWLEFEYTGVTTSAPPASPGQPSRPGGSGDSSGSSRAEPDTTTRDPANLPIPAQDHSNLPAGAEVHSETPWIQFNEVREAGIGVRSILDRGARQAIDVWGPMGVEAEVCFDGVGSILLLDAAYAPRLETPLVSYLRLDGKTCAQLDRAGTVVLMPGEPTHVVVPTATPPAPALVSGGAPVVTADGLIVDDPTTAVALANCHVGSFHVLNLRERPAGRILGWFHGDMTRALARTPNWFQIEYNGMVGWVSGHYAIVNGDCG